MEQTVKNVVFDLGGVLVDLDFERVTKAFEELGMAQVAEIISPYYPADVFGRLERGDISAQEACDQIRAMADRQDVADEAIANALQQFLVGIPVEKLRMVEALQQRGVRTYALSNNNPIMMPLIRQMFTADGRTMEEYFDGIYLSYEMHSLKPSMEIFRKMVDHSGIQPEESLFIDDGEKNVVAAHEMGFAVYMPAPMEDFRHLFDNLTE